MNFLFTLNASYLEPLCVCIRSINRLAKEENNYYIAHSSLNEKDMERIRDEMHGTNHKAHFINIGDEYFNGLTLLKHTSKETYYRLLCMDFLPKDVDRILYLDPDIVVINSLESFYNTDMGDNMIAMASHMNTPLDLWNSFRLLLPKVTPYYNAGVILFDIKKIRRQYTGSDILNFMETTHKRLDFADQDVLNLFFYGKTKTVDTFRYNLDLRMVKRHGISMTWIKNNASIIHYDGKDKPWHDDCKNPLGVFYKEIIVNDKKIVRFHKKEQAHRSYNYVRSDGSSDNNLLYKVQF